MMMPVFRTTATEKIERLEAELRVEKKRIAELEEFKLYYRNLVALHGYESITALLVSDGKKRERIAELEAFIRRERYNIKQNEGDATQRTIDKLLDGVK